jgi:hypothetical protein
MPVSKTPNPKSPRERARDYRARMRAKGLRPVTLWVPDLSDPEVRARIDRDCRAINEADKKDDIYEWLEAVQDWPTGDDVPDYDDGENRRS